jgi:sec-independent protein translocase protein TatC
MAKTLDREAGELDLWDHIDELRSRLLKALLALLVTTLVSFAFADKLVSILAIPVGGTDKLISIEVTENIGVFMKVALLSGFILALPFIAYQLLAFIIPGLTPAEKRWIYLGTPAATLLFVAGVAFAFLIMLPGALPFLTTFLGIKTIPRLSNYFSFVTSLLFWVGVSFETPLLVFILARFGLLTAGAMLRQWRIAVVVIAILAAVITPTPDPVNMGLLMLPLIGLYFISILMAVFARRHEPKPEKS